ncbi:MAG: hypothetical protein KGL43_01575 [Burkholderiales bacterium]|nr:hypothetical protein [Burkholderiales bacterium]
MATLTADRLWQLLPAVYRMRDADHGELRDLVNLFAREFAALEEDQAQLYDDLFIETCADWVAPYIGDLIGYRLLHGGTPGLASPRADVANTIAFRRRKGTATMLEEMARSVTGWPAHAVEFFQLLTTTQYMNHLRPLALATADLRDLQATLRVGSAFESTTHTAEMRRPDPALGRYNIPNIGLFVWRVEPLSLSRVGLVADPGDASGRRFRLDPLGADLRLFRLPVTEASISQLATPVNMPEPLAVRLLALQLEAAVASGAATSDDWGRSIALFDGSGAAIPLASAPGVAVVRSADLREDPAAPGHWAHETDLSADEIGIDAERGRVLLGSHRAAQHAAAPFSATLHLGQARRFGGGEYERTPQGEALALQQVVAGGAALQAGLDAVRGGGRLLVADSLTYAQTPLPHVDSVTTPGAPGLTVVFGARNGARPLIAAGGDITLDIGAHGSLVLDGLVISGATLRLAAAADDAPRTLVLRDCTLVPGRSLNPDRSPAHPGAVSLRIEHPFATVQIENSIVGALQCHPDAQVSAVGSVIDAGTRELAAFEGLAAAEAGATLNLVDCSVVGLVHTRALELASNVIFLGATGAATPAGWSAPLRVQRRQQGCVRFSWLPAGAITPRRYRCVSDDGDPALRPQFTSLRYGEPGYAQLLATTPAAIRQGADDEGEIGVMHPLAQPQREANLRIRLEEYLRFGLAAGLFYVT